LNDNVQKSLHSQYFDKTYEFNSLRNEMMVARKWTRPISSRSECV